MNSKSVIRPKSPKMVFACCVFSLIICSCISAIPLMFINIGTDSRMFWLSIVATVAAIFIIAYFGILLWSHIIRKIVIDEDRIYVCKDRGGKFSRTIQYAASVNFEDVVDLWLMISTKDSHNQGRFGLCTPMTYLVIDCKDGSQKLFNLFYYSKKQIANLLDLVIAKSRAAGSQIENKASADIMSCIFEQ